jgi:hypothetical protein
MDTKRKKVIKVICGIVVACMLIVILDSNFDIIKRQINQTVPVEIYNNDGVKTGETTVTINGTYYPHLFTRDVYLGEFSLPEFPDTKKEETIAKIQWTKRRGYAEEPMIVHYGETVYENLGSAFIDINRDMNEIVWWTTKGTIATSYEAYSNSIHFKK